MAKNRFPIWRLIQSELEAEIRSGLIGPGDQLPSEHDLAERFAVNRHTHLVHPGIARHGATLYQSGLPSTRRLELISEAARQMSRSTSSSGSYRIER
jgi:DNA-binding transcriptional MocR family regulator